MFYRREIKMKIKMINMGEVTQEFDSYEELIDYLNYVDQWTKIVVEKDDENKGE
jgi:hypothetical protein